MRSARAPTATSSARGSAETAAFGGGGPDRIVGGPGRDRLHGGAGDDVVLARDRERDQIVCGAGRDGGGAPPRVERRAPSRDLTPGVSAAPLRGQTRAGCLRHRGSYTRIPGSHRLASPPRHVLPTVRRELLGRGVEFENSFVVNPLCCPSRASFLTGRHSHSTGVYSNTAPYGGAAWFDDHSTLAT